MANFAFNYIRINCDQNMQSINLQWFVNVGLHVVGLIFFMHSKSEQTFSWVMSDLDTVIFICPSQSRPRNSVCKKTDLINDRSWQAPALDIILEIPNFCSMWKTCLEIYESVDRSYKLYHSSICLSSQYYTF